MPLVISTIRSAALCLDEDRVADRDQVEDDADREPAERRAREVDPATREDDREPEAGDALDDRAGMMIRRSIVARGPPRSGRPGAWPGSAER